MINSITEAKRCYLKEKATEKLFEVTAIIIEDILNNQQIVIPALGKDISKNEDFELMLSKSKTKLKVLFERR